MRPDGNPATDPSVERLRMAREAAGLSQGQAAKLMDCHRPTISEIEAGRRRVTVEELRRFADIYGVTVSWILGEVAGESGEVDERVRLAARHLSKISREDLDNLVRLLRSLQGEPEK